ncbi:hypothetical protein BAB74_23555 [Mycobacteroides abscessus]|nr:hypothetical protein BAB74_23555 [Mycobacteroides abscessus]
MNAKRREHRVAGLFWLVILRVLFRLLALLLVAMVELVAQLLPVLVELLVAGRPRVLDGLLFAVGGAVVGAVLVLDGGLAGLCGLVGLGSGAVVDGDAVVLI